VNSSAPWIADFVREINPANLKLEDFRSKYFPQYRDDWKPYCGIRLNKHGRPVRMPNKSDFKRHEKRRTKIVAAAYAQYTSFFEPAAIAKS
jgi:hypothetical protein